MKQITVISGKGGTGKTSLTSALASVAENSVFADCDVDAADLHLIMNPEVSKEEVFPGSVDLLIPQVNTEGRTGHGRCAEVCQYHAIVRLGGSTLVFPELCHGCGSCTLECPEHAITERPEPLGTLEAGVTPQGISFGRGLLDVGEPMAVPVIKQLKQWKPPQDEGVSVWDTPPGTSCPVVESIRGADYLLLVTEPTPFGLHDLKLAAQLAPSCGIPAGVVVNRDGVGDARVDDFCGEAGIPILMRIPLDREIGAGIAQGHR